MSRKNKNKNKLRVVANTSDVKPKFKVSASSMTPKNEPLYPLEKMEAPKVWYTNRAWQKMKKAIAICIEEVGWLGTVDAVDGGYLVSDIFVPEQTVHGTETDISAEALADLASTIDEPEKLCYWGHSHVNMGVSPSGQDEQQTAEYLEHLDVFIRGIYNKKGLSKVDVFDMENEMLYQAVQNGLLVEPLPDDEMEAFEKVVKENVKKRTYTAQTHAGSTPSNKGGGTQTTDRFQGQGGGRKGRGGVSVKSSIYENPFIKLENKA